MIEDRGSVGIEELQKAVKDLTKKVEELELDLVAKAENEDDLNGKVVIIVDDVLYTGRTVRSALDAVRAQLA